MPRLSSTFCSLLTDKVLKELRKQCITTADASFICKNVPLSIQEVHTVKRVLHLFFFPLNASTMPLAETSQEQQSVTVSTGCERIDAFFGGGVKNSEIFELTGFSATGKTQLCFCLTSSVLRDSSGYVVYITTTGSFSAKRISELLKSRILPDVDDKVESLLKRVIVYSATDVFQLMFRLWLLRDVLTPQAEEHQQSSVIKLLIIDSLSELFVPFSGNECEVLLLQEGVFTCLRSLAHEFSMAIVYTSTSNPFLKRGQRTKGSEEWNSLPDTAIRVSTNYEDNTVLLSLTKSLRLVVGSCHCFITAAGFEGHHQ